MTKYHLLPFIGIIGWSDWEEAEEQAPRMEGAHLLTVLGIRGVDGSYIPASEEAVFVQLIQTSWDTTIKRRFGEKGYSFHLFCYYFYSPQWLPKDLYKYRAGMKQYAKDFNSTAI